MSKTSRVALVGIVLVAGFVLCLSLAACGGSGGASASPSAAASASSDTGGGGTGGAGDTGGAPMTPAASALATALRGHWRDANGMDQYFDGTKWTTVTGDGEKWSFYYEVKSEDTDARKLVLTTFKLEGDGQTRTDVKDVTFTFRDSSLTKVSWGEGLTAEYVDEQERP